MTEKQKGQINFQNLQQKLKYNVVPEKEKKKEIHMQQKNEIKAAVGPSNYQNLIV